MRFNEQMKQSQAKIQEKQKNLSMDDLKRSKWFWSWSVGSTKSNCSG